MASIDVAVPCYQYGRFLRDNVGSILSQNVDQLRVLIIDNASTDNSREVAEQLANEDHRVSVIARKTNMGQQASYNEAIDWACADYFMILDADDILPAGALAHAISVLEQEPSVSMAHGTELQIPFDAGLPPLESRVVSDGAWTVSRGVDFVRAAAAEYKFIGATTVVRRTSAQKLAGHYHPNLKYANDLNMWLRLATVGDVAETPAVQGIRRLHVGQITEFYRKNPVFDYIERLNNLSHFFAHEGAALPGADAIRRDMEKAVAVSALWTGIDLYAKGYPENAASCVDFGLSLRPSAILPRIAKQVLRGRLPVGRLPAHLTAALRGASQPVGQPGDRPEGLGKTLP